MVGESSLTQTPLGLRFVPFPGPSSSGDEVFGEHGRCDLSPLPSLLLGFLGTREVQEVLISSINSANGIRFQLKGIMGFLGGMNSIPWVEKILWWRKWQPTLVGEGDDRR